MSHTRYELGFTRHRKVLSLSHEAFRLWISANDHARGQASNGELYPVDFDAIPRCPPAGRKRDALIEELVRSGLWEVSGDHWQIHDYLDWQDSRERIQNKKRTARERMQRVRANNERTEREVRSTDHTLSPGLDPKSAEGSPEGNHAPKDRFMKTFETLIPDVIPVTNTHHEICGKKNLDIQNELAKHRIWAKQHSRRCLDWPADFELWLRNARPVPLGSRRNAEPEPIVSSLLAEAKAALGNPRGDLF